MSTQQMTLKPRMSEKAYGKSEQTRTFVFDVPKTATKQSIAQAVTTQFNVSVEAVNTTVIKGKQKRTYRKSGRSVKGVRSDIKKAYVLVKEGQSIPIFEAVKEAEAAEEKQSIKIKAAMDKKAAKEDKKTKKEKA